MAAVCHAFVLLDFMCGILAEVEIGEVGEEVGDKIVGLLSGINRL
jgi:hypothetical protein